MIKPFSVILLLVILINRTYSQLPVLQWLANFGPEQRQNRYFNNGRCLALDSEGNVYSIGLFFGTVDFDPGPGVYNLTAPGVYSEAIYISKLSPSGKFMWAEQLPMVIEGPMYIAVDHESNVYITSELRQQTDMDPGSGIYNISPIGRINAFVLKLNKDGSFVWVKQFTGSGNNTSVGNALTVDSQNNLIVCGAFNGTVDFNPGPGVFNLSAIGSNDGFITKLSPDGDLIWAQKLGSTQSSYNQLYIQDVKTDPLDNIYTTGWFTGDFDFDPGLGTYDLVASGGADGFVSKLDTDGNFVLAKKIGNSEGANVVQPFGIDIDSKTNILIAGNFLGTQDFDPGVNTFNLTPLGQTDGFVLKLDQQGQFLWAKRIGGTNIDNCNDVTVDIEDNVYTVGAYYGNIFMAPGSGLISSNLDNCMILTKLDPNGNFLYAADLNNKNSNYGNCEPRRVVTDQAENIYITGTFSGTVDFDPGPAEYNVSSTAADNLFVLKWAKCNDITTSTLNINSCGPYLLNHHSYDSSGVYRQVIPNFNGCDSIITLNLFINKRTTTISKSICEGDSVYAGGHFQKLAGIYKDSLATILGCDSIVTTHLTVHPKPLPNLGPDQNICANSTVSLSPGSFLTYQWQDGSSRKFYTTDHAGTYWVKVTDSIGCAATDTLTIKNTFALPSYFINPIDSICSYGSIVLEPLKSFENYIWSTGSSQKQIEVTQPGNYWLKVIDFNGCQGIDTVKVVPKACMSGIYIPTAFTPNGDGKNDIFRAMAFGELQSFKLQVFDRWGSIIFQTSNPLTGWDGTINGRPLSSSIFVWLCTYQLKGSKPEYQKGTVLLIR